jgi:arylsulfatase A-like enzyme
MSSRVTFFLLLLALQSSFAALPNIVFILADDMRPDALGILGHPVVKTPHLDALAKEGTLFTRAMVGYPICHVSRAEMFTGCCAFRTGVQYRGKAIDPSLALWSDTLRRGGYHTWFSGKWHNDGQPKQRGFELTASLYSSGGSKPGHELPDYAGRPATGYTGWAFKTDDGVVEQERDTGLTPDTDRFITDGAISLIRRKPSGPFFLQVSMTGPHDPRLWPRGYEHRYDPATIPLPKNFAPQHPFDHGNAGGRDEVLLKLPRDPDEVRAELAAYYAVITSLDEQVGRIITALREAQAWNNTILIFTSDHGLALGSHGLTGKQNMYEHTVGVPLLMHGPGIAKGQRISAQCYLRDLFPTTCDFAGIAIPLSVESHSLAPLLRGESRAIYDQVVSCFTDTQRMLRDEKFKLIWYPKLNRYQLFNIVEDADEVHDLIADQSQAARIASMKQKLEQWLKANGDPLFSKPNAS